MMPFTVEDFRDLMRLVEERPEWRAELRRWVLSDEILTLPELVRALAEAQRRTAEQLEALIGVVRTLIIDVGELKGDALERRYRERAYAYFAPLLRPGPGVDRG
jgi:hypothetical protein